MSFGSTRPAKMTLTIGDNGSLFSILVLERMIHQRLPFRCYPRARTTAIQTHGVAAVLQWQLSGASPRHCSLNVHRNAVYVEAHLVLEGAISRFSTCAVGRVSGRSGHRFRLPPRDISFSTNASVTVSDKAVSAALSFACVALALGVMTSLHRLPKCLSQTRGLSWTSRFHGSPLLDVLLSG